MPFQFARAPDIRLKRLFRIRPLKQFRPVTILAKRNPRLRRPTRQPQIILLMIFAPLRIWKSSAITPVQASPSNAGRGTRGQREGVPEPAPSWSLFKPWTWFGKDKPAPNATPEEAEVRGGGFRIPGTDQSIGFGDQAVTLKTGGTVVQSGNPLPVRIEKIDPTAGGIGGDGGMGVGGGFGSGGVGGPGRRPSGSDAGGAAGYPGKINMPETGGRAGRGGSAGFGLYASDVGLAANKSLPQGCLVLNGGAAVGG